MKTAESRTGAALVTVLCLTFLAGVIATRMVARTGGHVLRCRSLVQREQAFYIAEGGAERAASYIAGGGAVPTTLTGSIGSGSFQTLILIESGASGQSGSLSGAIRINPNNSPDNSFLAVLPDGGQIARADLQEGMADYQGAASMVLVRPMGAGTQSLTVNGSSYTIQNNNTYSFSGDLQIRIYNDSRNPQGRAVGRWWIELTSSDATVSNDEQAQTIRRNMTFTIHSEGTVGGAKRTVTIRGLQTVSWAKYALWYNQEALELVMVGGESFEGPVYANRQLRFHSHNVATLGQTRFYDTVASTASSIHKQNNSVNPIFDRGVTLNAPVETMASVDFTELRTDASLILDGTTSVRISGDDVYITNSRRGWSNYRIDRPNDGLIYVRTVTTGTSSSRPGDLTVNATNGLAGRLTLVAERDILIDNHVRYETSPLTDPDTEDALGLIAGRHATVTTAAPNDLEIFAHIICRDGGFGVEDYSNTQRGPRGLLMVHGGIVNKIRNAVGTTAGGGYAKKYIYDTRFRKNPPPRYPALPDEFQWLGWDG
ncbi:MAG: hypothetical protein U1E27_08250 [Kiritimatiellia bacterium]|nr:hypothetical protein [Kiritimatiellia bacterium]